MALQKLIKEQCPCDTVESEMKECQQLLATKCTVLYYGLDLEELTAAGSLEDGSNVYVDEDNMRIPVILWNARLEEDKNPAAFIDLLHRFQRCARFRLIILGDDPSKGKKWFEKLNLEFGQAILHIGWCRDRTEYSSWLRRASIVVSTANHETFGISMVESAFCGVLPLIPRRLSYPEIFSKLPTDYFYGTNDEAIEKFRHLASLIAQPLDHRRQKATARQAVAHFSWRHMLRRYDTFFASIARGDSLVSAGQAAHNFTVDTLEGIEATSSTDGSSKKRGRTEDLIEIQESSDSRVQLYRPKSLRDHGEFNRQVAALRSEGIDPALHGGRRAVSRMLEASRRKAKITQISFLTTRDLAVNIFGNEVLNEENSFIAPVYVADSSLLNEIRGQKLNVGDAVLAMVHFPQQTCLLDIMSKPPILILDNVRNAENVGTMLRSAFCLGITSIIATSVSWSALKDSRAARSSMGTQVSAVYY